MDTSRVDGVRRPQDAAIKTSHASNSHSSGAPPRYAQFASRSMEYSEKNFKLLISSNRDKAVTSAAPLCATASANSGTVALSPKSSAFSGSRTAARSAVGLRVGSLGITRPAARVAHARSSSWGNLLPCLLSDETRAADGAALHIVPIDNYRNRPDKLCEAAGKPALF